MNALLGDIDIVDCGIVVKGVVKVDVVVKVVLIIELVIVVVGIVEVVEEDVSVFGKEKSFPKHPALMNASRILLKYTPYP